MGAGRKWEWGRAWGRKGAGSREYEAHGVHLTVRAKFGVVGMDRASADQTRPRADGATSTTSLHIYLLSDRMLGSGSSSTQDMVSGPTGYFKVVQPASRQYRVS